MSAPMTLGDRERRIVKGQNFLADLHNNLQFSLIRFDLEWPNLAW